MLGNLTFETSSHLLIPNPFEEVPTNTTHIHLLLKLILWCGLPQKECLLERLLSLSSSESPQMAFAFDHYALNRLQTYAKIIPSTTSQSA